MKYFATAAAAATFAVFATYGNAAEQDFSKIEVKTTDLGHNTYMLEGAGGNVTVAVGTDGVIIVDSQFAPMHDKLKAAIAKITDKPIKYLIDTHFHGDHTGGNEAFGKEGVIIVANEKLKDRLANPPAGANGQRPPASPAAALPKESFKDRMTVKVGGVTADVVHMEGHTDTDSVVYFREANVLSIGDTGGAHRYANSALGGSIDGMIAGVQAYVNMINDQTKIVPGHSGVATKADLQEMHDKLVEVRARVAKLKAEGKTEDQVAAAKPLSPDIQAWAGANDDASERLVRTTYQNLK